MWQQVSGAMIVLKLFHCSALRYSLTAPQGTVSVAEEIGELIKTSKPIHGGVTRSILTIERSLHPLNAKCSIVSTELGMEISVRPMRLLNAL